MELPRSQSFVNATTTSSRGEHALDVASDLAFDLVRAPAAHAPADCLAPVIVVGGGPSGLRAAQELARRDMSVILFNAERWRPYNRLKLTPFLAGEVQIGVVYQPNLFPVGARITQYTGQTIVAIDRASKTVENQFGRRWQYSKLVLGLGSHPYVPPISGRELSGVYRFRNFDDVELLVARSMRSRRAVVIGGGLLGLEAARGIAIRKVATVVVEHENHLMARQLDRAAGVMLEEQILAMGIDVRTGCSVKSIAGETRVEGVVLSTGEMIKCDNVIICTGIRSNIALARDADIAIGHGIKVNDAMQTSDPDIYAIGECAEHDGHIYGLVAPGLEQAAVAVGHLAGEAVSYRGSVPTTKLKIVGTEVFSMGDIEQVDQRTDVRSIVWQEPLNAVYRRLVLHRGRLIGAMAVGDWLEVARVQQAVRDRALLWPWQLRQMRRVGRLYPMSKPKSAAQWPAAAIVCNCTGVTRGQLGDAMRLGASTAELLMRETNASTVCGTCRPLLHEILGLRTKREPVFGARTIAAASLAAALILAVAVLLPAWSYAPSFERGVGIEQLWLDGIWKQISGFTLVGLSALLAFLSVRKRIGFKWLGDYRFWRIIHTAVGASVLSVLFLHTGFSLGQNLNRWLMTTFLIIAAVGSITGVITAREHAVLASGKASPRAAFVWLHIFACWPLPVLLLLHVVTVYAY